MENGRMATPRQVAYIERLIPGNGLQMDKPLSELTMSEASELIKQMVGGVKNNGNGSQATQGNGNGTKKNDFSHGARFGMAFKCCYRRWVGNGRNIFNDRKIFIKNVLDTYVLINEIAEKAAEVAA